ncbi:tyrosine-type recombinase/integrase [Rhodococcus marinonascens]|uniref:tyrosine-type recombinase/integrase n=1 Tax=Rhodococcus marinonascens TaxID=38311 RepID=UPI000B27A09D|nr:site-specific integrase [Rhodococcus marinonascens]
MAQIVDQWTVANLDGGKRLRGDRWGKGKRWLVRWDESGRRVSKAFENKEVAVAFMGRTSTEQADGTYITKDKRDVTLSDVWPLWWSGKAGKSKSTRDGYQAAWKHIEPKWGSVACQEISRAAVAAWLPTLTGRLRGDDGERLPLSESSTQKVIITLNGLLEMAVEERIVLSNPIRTKDAPRQKSSQRRYLSVAEVDRLSAVMPSGITRLIVNVLIRTGIRPGEAFGLQVGDLDASRGRLRISRDVDAKGAADDTKTGKHRDVPVGGELLLDLEDAAEGRGREEWLLADSRGGWTRNRWRTVWKTATEGAGLDDLDTYELRHTAASLAIHSGANVKTVQRMLGHSSAAMTLDIYGHLWDEELDALPKAMDEHMRAERKRFTERRERAVRQQGDSKII